MGMGTGHKTWKGRLAKYVLLLAAVLAILAVFLIMPAMTRTRHCARAIPPLMPDIDLPLAEPPETAPPTGSSAGSVPLPPPPPSPEPIDMREVGLPKDAPAAPTSTKTIDEAIKGLEWGETAFDAPQAMSKGKPAKATLVLSLSMTAAQLMASFGPRTNGVRMARARVSNAMEATLTGYGFSIIAMTPETQAVSGEFPTTWSWEVVPTSSGTLSLHLALSAFVSGGAHQAPLVVRTLDREVTVKVSPGQAMAGFFKGNWQWLWGTILAPVAIWAWRSRKTRRQHKGSSRRGG